MKKTDALLKQLKQTYTVKELEKVVTEVADVTLTFTAYLTECLESHGLNKSTLIRKAGLERTYGYQIMRGERRPGRDKVIALGLAGTFGLEVVQRLLALSENNTLYARNPRDAALIFLLEHHADLDTANEVLEGMGLSIVG